ncbi:Cohesin subunit psc3 [Wickerhamiella sorbophila]|uniref:Cohesin subunit psc3 n=1 Tax=Wickerhamiella sorbophila TaxID=45607 RepID=A0A2T0FEY4_9ASCO|nr:Cohesin subunit psc3 [Wickerhamiella sorbophila]PRT53529.1 Cohesin subunit psc3 [Wickerhamiella sorbophila]
MPRRSHRKVTPIEDDSDYGPSDGSVKSPASTKRRRTETRDVTEAPRKPRLDNPLFDSLADRDTPLEDVVGGTVRMLEYDPNNGLLDLLNLVVKAAGCATSVQLTAPGAAATDLEAATKGYAPAKYPLTSDRDFARRYADFFATMVPELAVGEILGTQDKLVKYLKEFSTLSLRSIRHAASVALFSLACELATVITDLESTLERRTRHVTELQSQLDQIVKLRDMALATTSERVKDVFPPIREIAARALAALDPAQLGGRLLNDEVAAVRLAALKGLVPQTQAQWKRVLEIAQRDVDTRCRKQALKVLVDGPPTLVDKAKQLVFDADASVRIATASLAIEITGQPSANYEKYKLDPAWGVLQELGSLNPTPEVAESMAKAGKFTFKSATSFALYDFSRLSVRPEDKKWADGIQVPHAILPMALGFGRSEWEELQPRGSTSDEKLEKCGNFAAGVLETVPRLLSEYDHDEERLPDAVQIFMLVDLAAVARRGLETAYEEVLAKILRTFADHTTKNMAVTIQQVLAKALDADSPVSAAASAEAQSFYDKLRSSQPPNLLAISSLAPYIDISDMAETDFWATKSEGSVALALALGTFYPTVAAKHAAQHLSTANAVEELLSVYIIASVQQVALPELPKVPLSDVSERTLAAAKAARVI